MKKTMLLLFAVTVLTFGCADNAEDTMPDPVVPEVQLDDQKSGTEDMTKTKPMGRKKRG